MTAPHRLVRWPPDDATRRELARPAAADAVVVAVPGSDDPPTELVTVLLEALDGVDAAVVVEPLVDAVKRTDPSGLVLGPVDRGELAGVGWPQAIRADVLAALVRDDGGHGLDDPALRLVALGRPVRGVDAPPAAAAT